MMDKPDGEEVPVTQNFLSATVTECDYMGDGRWCISVDQGEATFCWPDPLVTLQLDVAQSAPRRAARPLSDEAAFLRRLADPYGDGNPETQAEFANAVQEAVTEMGPGHWQDAYQELQPDWQPPPGDAQVELARLKASISTMRTYITELEAQNARANAEIQNLRRMVQGQTAVSSAIGRLLQAAADADAEA